MNWIAFFTGMCGVYSITGAYAAIKCGMMMWDKQYLTKGERAGCAAINLSWIAAVGFMVWRLSV